MNQSISVRVRDKESGIESTISYQAYKDTAYRFELLGQIDEQGNLIPGDPNLLPQHQRKSEKAAAVASVETRPRLTQEELEAKRQELLSRLPSQQPQVEEPVKSEPVEEPITKRKYTKRQTTI